MRESVVERSTTPQIAGFSSDGAWDPAAIDVIRASLKELGILPTVPDAKALYTDAVRAGAVLMGFGKTAGNSPGPPRTCCMETAK